MLIRSRVSGVKNLYQSKGGLWDKKRGLFVPRDDNILYILGHHLKDGRVEKEVLCGHNLVTNLGDLYYAESLAIGIIGSGAPTDDHDFLYLSTTLFSPAPVKGTDAGDLASTIAGSKKALTATYPKVNDGDADNTGSGTDIVTHLFTYTTGDFNDATIEGVCIAETATTFGSGTDPILNARNETAFAKTATDTLKVFINHTITGV